MATFSKKIKGKEVGSAAVYAVPHTMDGKVMRISNNPGTSSNMSNLANMRVSLGQLEQCPAPEAKTDGIKIRGVGCATKGVMARGPMA